MANGTEQETCEFLCIHQDVVADVRENIPPAEELGAMAELFKLFGDPTRIKILCSLLRHELCVCDLAALIGMNQSAVSHQLRLLKQGQLVRSRREGKSIFYSLADDHVETMLAQGLEHVLE